jgi:hypothetical protein
MDRDEAEFLYKNVLRDGSYEQRNAFLNTIKDWDLGLTGQIAKNLNDELDGKFLLGVEIGIMIGLNLVFGFRKETNE